ncbi:DNA-directed RNA polymerase subunit RPC12/RpoP [Fictibacillus halophilus]|uniref:DNA-directed RNA polymerase subunit RPC12/RpoP n=1 Tax=Fictibacillus halophilus TaxID=1610490 RepID=A0ABV2LJZ7_9BACL|nr:GapA-binding peptide SR1P [Fictibacillus halophilus]
MGVIICQTCETTIEHFEEEKVTTLYSNKCPHCHEQTNLDK